jgi:hypothetical protein
VQLPDPQTGREEISQEQSRMRETAQPPTNTTPPFRIHILPSSLTTHSPSCSTPVLLCCPSSSSSAPLRSLSTSCGRTMILELPLPSATRRLCSLSLCCPSSSSAVSYPCVCVVLCVVHESCQSSEVVLLCCVAVCCCCEVRSGREGERGECRGCEG